jgi:hypothetical protein
MFKHSPLKETSFKFKLGGIKGVIRNCKLERDRQNNYQQKKGQQQTMFYKTLHRQLEN